MVWLLAMILAQAGEGSQVIPTTNTRPAESGLDLANRVQVQAVYSRLPLSFEANRGQTDAQVKFLARGRGYTLFLTATEVVLVLRQPANFPSSPRPGGREDGPGERHFQPEKATATVLRMKLVGANPVPQVVGLEELPGKVNYFLGKDPIKWRTNVPIYAKVRYQEVYPGVILEYYGTQGQLEYDFIVAPGGNPNAIRLSFQDQAGQALPLRIDAQGDLILQTAAGELRLRKPRIYQEINGVKQAIPGRYVLLILPPGVGKSDGFHQVGFEVTAYDASKPLVIDPVPVLSYSTYLGGSDIDGSNDLAIDAAGNVYVTGLAYSTDFPTVSPIQATNGGNGDAFVTKLDPTGSALLYSTYLGGSDLDISLGIAVDAAGNAYVTGFTRSTDFPTVNPVQPSFIGFQSAFVTKIDPTGSALVYSTYLGGGGSGGTGIAVDAAGNAYVTGDTDCGYFPTTPGAFQPSSGGGIDAFVTKLDSLGSALVYSTCLGGAGLDVGLGITVDGAGNTYVTGYTRSDDFPTANPFQPARQGEDCGLFGGPCEDAFVTKVTPNGSSLVYSTYLGGTREDFGEDITVDDGGNAYVVGSTNSPDFPTVSPIQPELNRGVTCFDLGGEPCRDAFVTKFNAAGSALVYSTFLGGGSSDGIGNGGDEGRGIAVDTAGNTYVTGSTSSIDFPTVRPFQPTFGGASDAFVTKLDPIGSAFIYSTYLGGSGSDSGAKIAVDAAGSVYVTGLSTSIDFPTASPLQSACAGGGTSYDCFDAFVAKISDEPPPPGVDTTPPSAPIGLTATPSSWTTNNLFSIDWTNPSDESGIAKVWYKVGSFPTSPSDGIWLSLPQFKPFFAAATVQGGQPIYVWLEDGAGNKDHNNRSSSSLLVTLNLSASDTMSGIGAGAQMRFSNDGFTWSPPEPYSTTRTNWDLASYGGNPNPGTKTVYVQFKDVAGNWSPSFSDDITYSPTTLSPTICFNPSILPFTATEGGPNPPSQTLNIWNCGGGTLNWSATDDAAWLSLNPTSGSSTGETDPVTISVEMTGLGAGTYPASITISDQEATNSPQTVPVTLTVTAQQVANPWPMFGHDEKLTGQSPFTGPQDIRNFSAKVVDTLAPIVTNYYFSPIIGSNVIYLLVSNGIMALGIDGTPMWEFYVGPFASTPTVGTDGTIYTGTDLYKFYAITPDGKLKWQIQTDDDFAHAGYAFSPATVGPDGTIYVIKFGMANPFKLHAIGPEGSLAWSYNFNFDEGLPWSSIPAIDSNSIIYVGTERADTQFGTRPYTRTIYAIGSDGSLRWKYSTAWPENAQPAFSSNTSVAVSSDNSIYFVGLEPTLCCSWSLYKFNSEGSVLWKKQLDGYAFSGPSVSSDGTIYLISLESDPEKIHQPYLLAFDINGNLKWKYKLNVSQYWGIWYLHPAIGSDGVIYWGWNNYVEAINPDGTQKWSKSVDTTALSSPAINSDGTLYLYGDTKLYAFARPPRPLPYISSLSPTSGPPGTLVTLTGENFGATQDSSTVNFQRRPPDIIEIPPESVAFVAAQSATPAEIVSWSDTQIQARVPSVTTGKYDVTVTTSAGTSNAVSFEVTAPPPAPILSVSPSSLDFGLVPVGGSKDLNFTVQNTGGGTLDGSCTTDAPFSLPEGCAFSLLAGQSKQVKVRFSPPSVGTFIRNVSFTSNGGNASPIVQGEGVEVAITWTTPPPPSVTSGENFTVAWSISGATTIEHINVHWDPVDPTAITTCSSEISCSTVSPTPSPFTLTAPSVTAPTVIKYAVHARVNEDGIDRFTDVVSVTVNPSPTSRAPNPPTTLNQFRSDGVTPIQVGAPTDESTVIFKATVSDPDGDQVKLQIELRRLDEFGGAFTGEPTQESAPVMSGSQAQIVAFGLINGNYHWRVRTIDATGAASDWVSFGGNPDSAADFIVERPARGPDLAVLAIRAFTPEDPQGLPTQGKESFIEITIQNVGDTELPASQYVVSVTVWDLKGEPKDEPHDTFEAKEHGRALIDVAGFLIDLPRIPPQPDPKSIMTIMLPTVGKRFAFTSARYSDELRVMFLPPFPGAPAFDSNPDNDVKVLGPDQFRVVAGSGRTALNCMEEIWTVTMTTITTLAVVGAVKLTTPAAIGLAAATATYLVLQISVELFFEFTLALAQGRPIEAGEILAKAVTHIAILGLKLTESASAAVFSLIRVAINEWNGVGCLALIPLSDAKQLIWSLIQGFQKGLNTLIRETRDVFWFLGGSPVDLLVTDTAGRRVAVRFDGTVESEIPEAAASRIGDVSTGVITLLRSDTYAFQVSGLDTGTARVGLIQPRLDGSVSTVLYEDVPQQQKSSATVVVGPTTTEYPLQLDVNGDGTTDETRPPSSMEVFSPPPVPPLVFVTTSLPDAEVGTPYSVQLEATGGKPPYRFTLVEGTLPPGLGLLGTGEIVGTPTAAVDATFTAKVEDLLGSSATAELTLKASPPNRPPIADAGPDQTVDEGTTVTLDGTGSSDPDGDPLNFTWTQIEGPSVTLIGADTATPSFTAPEVGPAGVLLVFQLIVNDGIVSSAPDTVNINVSNVNQPPIADPQSVTTPEDTPKAITLTGSDPDADPLTFVIVTGPTSGTLSGTPPNVTYTPNTNFNGSDNFTFKVNDGQVDSAPATVSITITPVNDPPVADPQSVTAPEDTPIPITLTGSDPDGDALIFTIVTLPTSGTLSGTAPNVTYTPTPNFNGSDNFTFKVNDGTVDSAPATISITVTPVNDPPVANPQTVTTAEDTPVGITLTGSDVDGDPLTFVIVTLPGNGALSGTPPNLTYTPNPDFNGSDSFTFKVNDGQVDSSPATVSITVTPVNDPPVANSQSVTTAEDTPKAITLTGSDVDGDALTFSIVMDPTKGVLSGTPPEVTYTPNPDYNGPDSFTFKVNDGEFDSAPAMVSLTITPVNDPPIADAGPDQAVNEGVLVTLDGTGSSDPDGDLLTFRWSQTGGPAVVLSDPGSPTPSFTAPSVRSETPLTFQLIVNDGMIDSVPDSVTVTVRNIKRGGSRSSHQLDEATREVFTHIKQLVGQGQSVDKVVQAQFSLQTFRRLPIRPDQRGPTALTGGWATIQLASTQDPNILSVRILSLTLEGRNFSFRPDIQTITGTLDLRTGAFRVSLSFARLMTPETPRPFTWEGTAEGVYDFDVGVVSLIEIGKGAFLEK